MKTLITTIAAVVLVGCGASVTDISIHRAAYDGNIEAVKQHLAAGTDVNVKNEDDNGMTPLHYAAFFSHRQIAELLIATGADVNAKEEDGMTPLHVAAHEGHKEIAELLIAKSADVNLNNKTAGTPLHYAVSKGQKEIAELLIEKGADVNAAFNNVVIPLHYAASKGHKEIVELLIAKGADVNAKCKLGTPLDIAIEDAESEIADFLRKHGGKTGEELKAEGNPVQ